MSVIFYLSVQNDHLCIASKSSIFMNGDISGRKWRVFLARNEELLTNEKGRFARKSCSLSPFAIRFGWRFAVNEWRMMLNKWLLRLNGWYEM